MFCSVACGSARLIAASTLPRTGHFTPSIAMCHFPSVRTRPPFPESLTPHFRWAIDLPECHTSLSVITRDVSESLRMTSWCFQLSRPKMRRKPGLEHDQTLWNLSPTRSPSTSSRLVQTGAYVHVPVSRVTFCAVSVDVCPFASAPQRAYWPESRQARKDGSISLRTRPESFDELSSCVAKHHIAQAHDVLTGFIMSLTRVEFYPEAECRRSRLFLGLVRSRREAREMCLEAAGWVKVYDEPSVQRLPIKGLGDVPIMTSMFGKEVHGVTAYYKRV